MSMEIDTDTALATVNEDPSAMDLEQSFQHPQTQQALENPQQANQPFQHAQNSQHGQQTQQIQHLHQHHSQQPQNAQQPIQQPQHAQQPIQHPEQPIQHSQQPQHAQQPIQHSQQPQHAQQPIQHFQHSQHAQQQIQHSQQPQHAQQPIQHSQHSQHAQQQIQHSQQPQHAQQPIQQPQQPQHSQQPAQQPIQQPQHAQQTMQHPQQAPPQNALTASPPNNGHSLVHGQTLPQLNFTTPGVASTFNHSSAGSSRRSSKHTNQTPLSRSGFANLNQPVPPYPPYQFGYSNPGGTEQAASHHAAIQNAYARTYAQQQAFFHQNIAAQQQAFMHYTAGVPPVPIYAPGPIYPPAPISSRASTSGDSSGHSSDRGSSSDSSRLSSASSTSTVRQKRRRTSQEPEGAGPSSAGGSNSKGKGTSHGIPGKDFEMLNNQIFQIQQNLHQLVQSSIHPPQQESLLTNAAVAEQLVSGMKEAIGLLRANQPAAGSSNLPNGSSQPANPDVAMSEAPSAPLPIIKRARSGPVHRGLESKVLNAKFREFFNSKFKGQVLDRSSWDPKSDRPCCDIENFRLDLLKPPGDPWNLSARRVLIDAFTLSDDPTIMALKPTKEDLIRLFVLNHRRVRSQRQWDAMDPEEKEQARRIRRRTERKRWLYYRRVRVADRYKETKRHLSLLAALGPEGMSTDASDHDNLTGAAIFRVKHEYWRHPHASSCLQSLDALHRDSRFRPIRRNTAGAHPHLRVASSLVSTSPPVARLPQGLYNEAWLSTLPPRTREDLGVIPSGPYDFSHENVIQTVIDTNNGRLDSVHGFL